MGVQDTRPGVDEFDEDHEWDEDAAPIWFQGHHLPPDARAMGLGHQVPEGALLDFAGRLDGTKARHRIAAWVMLAVFGLPVVFAVMRVLEIAWT